MSIKKCKRFLKRIGILSDVNSFMTSNPIVNRIKMASNGISTIIVIMYITKVIAIIETIKASVIRLAVFSPVFRKMIKKPINRIVILMSSRLVFKI